MFTIKDGAILIVPNPYQLEFNESKNILLLTDVKSLHRWKLTLINRPNITVKTYKRRDLNQCWDEVIFDRCEDKIFLINRYKKILSYEKVWFIFRRVIFKSYDRVVNNFLPSSKSILQFDPDELNVDIVYLKPLFLEEELYLIKWLSYALAHKHKVADQKTYEHILDIHLDPVLTLSELLIESVYIKKYSRYIDIVKFLGTGQWLRQPFISGLQFHSVSYDISTRIKSMQEAIKEYQTKFPTHKCCVAVHTELYKTYLTPKFTIPTELSEDLFINKSFQYNAVFCPQKRIFDRFELGIAIHSLKISKHIKFFLFKDTKLEAFLRPCKLYSAQKLTDFIVNTL
ncbi:hypothetical protein LDVICp104 [lymphocystis disease virus-China]|uniref:Uncharacterized protein n=2 Tax=Lymphocystis disease virus 2 TaxID=159183 RepID=A0A6F8X1R5_9VIRU|nr:hypothetical protein LDVICp104 [lymphocystis disease virus-China]AAU10949.1 hypothetical protein [lymphocystis disease virus-China]BCB67471.1 hypothetical protein [Lymphocystis disease virus 2]